MRRRDLLSLASNFPGATLYGVSQAEALAFSSTGTLSAPHLVALTRAACVLMAAGNSPSADDLLRTIDAVSPVATGAVLASLLMFVVIYNLLLVAVIWYGARIVMKGPDLYEDPPPNAVRPGLVQAGPAIVGGYIPVHASPATGD